LLISAACDEVWNEYEKINNPVVGFLEEHDISDSTVEEVYIKYQIWCLDSGLKSLSKSTFGKEIKKQGYNSEARKNVNGLKKRIYTKDLPLDTGQSK